MGRPLQRQPGALFGLSPVPLPPLPKVRIVVREAACFGVPRQHVVQRMGVL